MRADNGFIDGGSIDRSFLYIVTGLLVVAFFALTMVGLGSVRGAAEQAAGETERPSQTSEVEIGIGLEPLPGR
ncbi:hypothetical protein [Maioricimonas rarisocia]|nr:hypothetical protein [Maioricimonas rarisocia]